MSEEKKTARQIIEGYDGPAVRIMEVCGTHTHEIFRLGIRKLLPKQVELISGPGCPVCVTPDVVVKVNPERADLVETREIDGRRCLVIAIDDHLEVNGIEIN